MFGSDGQSDEEFVRFVAPRAGRLNNLHVYPTLGAPTSGAIVTVTVRVNALDTALTVMHTASTDGANTVSNVVDIINVSQGDSITVEYAESGGVEPGAILYRATFGFN